MPVLRLVHSIKVSYVEGCYVLDGCLANGGASLCLSTSQPLLKVFDTRTSAHVSDIAAHTKAITDVVSGGDAAPAMLYSCQEDGGIVVSDLRAAGGQAVATIGTLCGRGRQTTSLAVSPSGVTLAVGSDGDLELLDARTWTIARTVPQLHADELTRVRFLRTDTVLCSAGEDQLANFVDLAAASEDDLLLSVTNCGEVVTKMTLAPAFGAVCLIGSCESGFVCPDSGETMERKIARRDFATYMVDFVELGGALCVVRGTKDDDGNAGPLDVSRVAAPGTTREDADAVAAAAPVGVLLGAHQEVVRVALGWQQSRLITGGEDGSVAFWALQDAAAAAADGSSASSGASLKAVPPRPNIGRRGKPY